MPIMIPNRPSNGDAEQSDRVCRPIGPVQPVEAAQQEASGQQLPSEAAVLRLRSPKEPAGSQIKEAFKQRFASR